MFYKHETALQSTVAIAIEWIASFDSIRKYNYNYNYNYN